MEGLGIEASSKKDWKQSNEQTKMSMEDFKKSSAYTDKSTRREQRLKKEVNMTPEEYKANQAAKKQKFQDSMNRLAMTLHPDHDPLEVAEFDESVRTRGQEEETERINNEYKIADTKRMNLALDAYKAKKLETDELSNTESYAGDANETNMKNTDE